MAAEEKGIPFSILVACDAALAKKFEKCSVRRFNLVHVVTVTRDVWSQIAEMLKMVGEETRTLSFTALGMIGVRTKEELLELSKHGSVEWCPGWGGQISNMLGIEAAEALIQSARGLKLPGIKIGDTIG